MAEGVEPNTQDGCLLHCEPLGGISVIGYRVKVGEFKKHVEHLVKGAYLSTAIIFVGSFLVLVGRLVSCCVHEQHRTPEDPLAFSMCIAAFCITQICSTVPYVLKVVLILSCTGTCVGSMLVIVAWWLIKAAVCHRPLRCLRRGSCCSHTSHLSLA